MKKLISALMFTAFISSTAFALELDCTNLNEGKNALKISCGQERCILNSKTEGASTSVNIPLQLTQNSTRTTVNFANEQANLDVILVKRGASLENTIMGRVFINGELVSVCK